MSKAKYHWACVLGVLINLEVGSGLVFGPSHNNSVGAISGVLMGLWFNFAGFGDKRWDDTLQKSYAKQGFGLGLFAVVANLTATAVVAVYRSVVPWHMLIAATLIVGALLSTLQVWYFGSYSGLRPNNTAP